MCVCVLTISDQIKLLAQMSFVIINEITHGVNERKNLSFIISLFRFINH